MKNYMINLFRSLMYMFNAWNSFVTVTVCSTYPIDLVHNQCWMWNRTGILSEISELHMKW